MKNLFTHQRDNLFFFVGKYVIYLFLLTEKNVCADVVILKKRLFQLFLLSLVDTCLQLL